MKKVLLISFVFIFNTVKAQIFDFGQYKRLNNLAITHDSLENYATAIVYYDSMFSIIDFYPNDYFDAFNTAWKIGDAIKANNYLIQGGLKGLDISGWYGEDLDNFRASNAGLKYLKIKDSLINEHYKSIDKDYFDALEKLVVSDQNIRDGSAEMIYKDSLNFDALIKLSQEKGFPTFPSVGYGCNKAWLLLWHHRGPKFPDSYQWKQIIPLIHREIRNGNLRPDFLKRHEDFNQKKGYNSK